MIEATCRTFLWTGKREMSRRALVAWEKVCRPGPAGAWVVRKIIDSREVLINSTSAARVLLQEMKKLKKQGKFQVKATYHYLQQQNPRVPWKSFTLHKHLHPRQIFHLWLVVQQRLSTVDPLQKFGIQLPGMDEITSLVAPVSKYWLMVPKSWSGFVTRQSREIAWLRLCVALLQ
ncbi:hypothetical protein MTR67_001367 [Solanum verrucosum]|uniref:Reverse transcriptase zinc-binding domain-containing protein n=1 Tax=Solanum verrucosum TaxID=315347 RepID=A0AAF0PP59_SOLVR|nr:hypothetical protein MTR67_001367 [Solanum verrucosum]